MPIVLLVEDNEMNRDMLSRRLTKKGYTVEIAVDGEQAVNIIDAIDPDIVLMDISLPKMDGLEATRRIRSSATMSTVPIIVLTANATVADRESALAAGCDDFETKPINLPQLLEKMNVCLSSST